METKFLNSMPFYKAAPILSTIILISTVIGLDTPYNSIKLLCGIVGSISLFAFIKCAKRHNN